jgi:hypothetical protein
MHQGLFWFLTSELNNAYFIPSVAFFFLLTYTCGTYEKELWLQKKKKIQDSNGFTCFELPWMWKSGFWNAVSLSLSVYFYVCIYVWIYSLLVSGFHMYLVFNNLSTISLCLVNMNILGKKNTDNFLKNGSNDFNYISVILGDRFPK